MIEESAPGLLQRYVTILEVGGAHAHRFSGLLKFLSIPYLVITDLDSVKQNQNGRYEACRADTEGAQTSNSSLKHFLGVVSVARLRELGVDEKTQKEHDRFIVFQTPVKIVQNSKSTEEMLGRTFEEAFIYQNLDLCRAGNIALGIEKPQSPLETYETVYEFVREGKLKKTDFALTLLGSTAEWVVPEYISEGLGWLAFRLNVDTASDRGQG